MLILSSFSAPLSLQPTLLLGISLLFPLASVLLISLFVMRSTWLVLPLSLSSPESRPLTLLFFPLLRDAHNSALSVLMSWTVSGIVTQVVKIMVGRPRPDLIDRCVPSPGAHDAPLYGLSNYTICTQTNAFILNDGFKS